MTRQQYLDWAKERALEICDSGDWAGAYSSFYSDMNKHDELRNHIGLTMMTQMFFGGMLSNVIAMRYFIEGFN